MSDYSLAKKYPSLAEVKGSNPGYLISLKGFVYSSENCLGSGSFGKVLLGWTKDGKKEVAVKVIERSFLKKEPKLKENLEREIRILKLMTHCDYVVKILDYQESKKTFLLVMEKCEYDLDHLIKRSPLSEDQVITFLYQLAEGMKALRRQNIVHRDLKPGNILIKEDPVTRKKMFKLADFGFARRFKDDADRIVNMKSLAGTPVYMAPEALQCVFSKGKVYDDKVDIWSIGALLYKVIVGECGFYATLEMILDLLERKGDAIAFEFPAAGRVNYIQELPSSVNTRLTEPFRQQMNKLLQYMLKVDPRERMSFPVFFDIVEDIITSKIEVISLLHGTSFKIVSDSKVKAETLVEKVCERWRTPRDNQIIFSPKCSHYVSRKALSDSAHSDPALSDSAFEDLLYKSGGSYGHARLYVLDTDHQKSELMPDLSCLEPLKFAIDNGQTAQLISEAKFCDEIVYMIDSLKLKLVAQLEGLEKLAQFTVQEISLSRDYFKLLEDVHQTLAKVSLVMEWLGKEMTASGACSERCQELLKQLTERKGQLQDLAEQLGVRSIPTLTGPFNLREYRKVLSNYKDIAKRLHRVQKDAIPVKCNDLYEKCAKIIASATSKTRTQLLPFAEAWAARRALYDRSAKVLDVAELLRNVEEEREKALMAHAQSWHPSGNGSVFKVDSSPLLPSDLPVSTNGATKDDDLMRQVARLSAELTTERTRCRELGEELARRQRAKELEIRMEEEGETPVEERTIVSPVAESPRAIDGGHEMADLSQQLRLFCSEAQRIILPVPGANFYADLSAGSDNGEDFDMRQLLVMSQELANTLKSNLPSLKEIIKAKIDDSSLVLRIANPSEYRKGDVAVFVPFKMNRGFTVPSILHLQGSRPSMLMDVRSFAALGIKPGRVPDLLFAQLTETPRQMKLENHKQVAEDIGEKTGLFYRMNAIPVALQLSGRCPLLLPAQVETNE